MNILVYDTETQCLPQFNLPSEHPDQPHIVEIACTLFNDYGVELGRFQSIVKPDGWIIPDDVAAIHGITTERAMDEGVDESKVLAEFLDMHVQCDLRVAHNETFDQRIARIAIKRFWRIDEPAITAAHRDTYADQFKAFPAFCTMNASKPILNLPPTEKMLAKRMKGPKSPNLTEAYLHFTGKTLEGAHQAMNDVNACAEIYFALKGRVSS